MLLVVIEAFCGKYGCKERSIRKKYLQAVSKDAMIGS